jgi:hypothetical protein
MGDIKADRINADNVVSGTQIVGGDAALAAELVRTARAIRGGDITAGEILAGNVVTGLQFIAAPSDVTADNLRREVAALRAKLEEAVSAGEVEASADTEDADVDREAVRFAWARDSTGRTYHSEREPLRRRTSVGPVRLWLGTRP